MKTLTEAQAKALIELINRLDPISLARHQEDVAHISLIGRPEDIFALDAYLMEKKKP